MPEHFCSNCLCKYLAGVRIFRAKRKKFNPVTKRKAATVELLRFSLFA